MATTRRAGAGPVQSGRSLGGSTGELLWPAGTGSGGTGGTGTGIGAHPVVVKARLAWWCLRDGEPAALLPPDFTVVEQTEAPGHRRQLIARNFVT